MNRMERDASREPGLYPFGTKPLRRLTAEEEASAPFEDRLRSVWPYLVRRARRFSETLSPRERAHMGAEDVVAEVVVSLIEKDHYWDAARGRYVTFAERVVRNVLSVRLERARVISAPSNASARLARYRAQEAAGTLSAASGATMRALAAVLGESEEVGPGTSPTFGGAFGRDLGSDEAPKNNEVAAAIRALTDPAHAAVLGRTFGLFGSDELTAREIADRTGADPDAVRKLQGRAKTAIRRRIEKMREPKP